MAEATEETTTETTTKAVPPEQEERIVDKVVTKVREIVKEIVGDPAPDGEGEEEGEPLALGPGDPSTPRQQESEMEGLVRAELAKIGAMEEQAKVNEHVKKEMERAPVQLPRVTEFLWGGGRE